MKNITFKNLAQKYQYENGIAGVKTVAFGNFFLLVIILIGVSGKIAIPSIAFFSLISGLLIFLGNLFYGWTSPKINFLFLLIYTLLVVVELSVLGIPEAVIISNNGLSKGFFLEIMLYMVPFIYLGVRITLIIPLLIIWYRSLKLIRVKN